MNFLCSWSGGKDSSYAFLKVLQSGYKPSVLLNVMNENGDRSRSHGITKEILHAQANAIGIPIIFFNSTWEDYEKKYIENLCEIVKEYPIQFAVFGDIDIQLHREWEEKVSAAANLKALLPLWQSNRKQLVLEMLHTGIEAMIVSCNKQLGPDFLGRIIDEQLLETLESMGVDACGENGEYHTLVLNAPFFQHKLQVTLTGREQASNYNFAILQIDSNPSP